MVGHHLRWPVLPGLFHHASPPGSITTHNHQREFGKHCLADPGAVRLGTAARGRANIRSTPADAVGLMDVGDIGPNPVDEDATSGDATSGVGPVPGAGGGKLHPGRSVGTSRRRLSDAGRDTGTRRRRVRMGRDLGAIEFCRRLSGHGRTRTRRSGIPARGDEPSATRSNGAPASCRKRIVSGSSDKTVRLWNADRPTPWRPLVRLMPDYSAPMPLWGRRQQLGLPELLVRGLAAGDVASASRG
jgi:hypothetical protein